MRVENAKRAPVYFNGSELDALMEKRKSLVNLDRFPRRTGFTQSVVEGLIQSGHIRRATGPAARFLLPSVEPGEIVWLERRLAANSSQPLSDQMPLLVALRETGAGEQLVRILQQCLDGNFRFSLAPRGENILSRLMVVKKDVPRPGNEFDPSVVFPERMTARDIEIMLDVPEDDVPGLLAKGCLKRRHGRSLEGQSVRRLAVRYISHRCLATRLNRNVRALKSHMASLGLRPAVTYCSAAKTPGFLWNRAKAAEVLGT